MLLDGLASELQGPIGICSLALASQMCATVPSASVYTAVGSLNLGPHGCLTTSPLLTGSSPQLPNHY